MVPRWKNIRWFFSKKYAMILGGILLAFSPLFLTMFLRTEVAQICDPIVLSHRGVSTGKFSENTISGIMEAKKEGADIVEIDVYQDKSGTLVLSHDHDLSRIFHIKKNISDLTDAEIEKIKLPNGEKIPTLQSVLKIAKMYDIPLLIEPKIHGKETNLPGTLVNLLNSEEMVAKTQIHSLNIELLHQIKKLQPHLQVGLILFAGSGHIATMDVDFFSLQEGLATRSTIEDIKKFEKKVYVWTLNNPENVGYYMKNGVDGIITDNVPKISQKISEVLRMHD